MLCGGHVARAHINKLKKMAKTKTFTKRCKNKHKETFPYVETVECCSVGKHKKRCGCLSDKFIRQMHGLISSAALFIQIKIQIPLTINYVIWVSTMLVISISGRVEVEIFIAKKHVYVQM